MALTFPELTRLANGATASYASYEADQLRGTALKISSFDSASLATIGSGDFSAGSHNLGKRTLGTMVTTTGANPGYYIYSPETIDTDINISGSILASSAWTNTGNWKKLEFSGSNAVFNNISASGNVHIDGNTTIVGNLTFGDSNTDTISFGADVVSNIIPDTDDTYDLGSSTYRWRNIYADDVKGRFISGSTVSASSGRIEKLTVTEITASGISVGGGGLNNVAIGTTVSSSGNFTTGNFQVFSASDAYLTNVTIGGSGAGASTIVNTAISGGDGDFNTLKVKDLDDTRVPFVSDTNGELSHSALFTYNDSTELLTVGSASIGSFTSNLVDIGGGAIDGTIIGATVAAAASVTSLDVANNNITNVGDIDTDSISIADAAEGLNIDFSDGNTTKNKITLKGGSADALSFISGSTKLVTFDTSGGPTTDGNSLTFNLSSSFSGQNIADLGSVTTADINGGSIDGTTIGANESSSGVFDTLTARTTNVNGALTVGSGFTFQTNTADINGGAIDGTIIGASTQATAKFSTLETTGIATIAGHLTCEAGITIYGDVTNIDATNLRVADQFITLNSGSTSGDSGIVFSTRTGSAGEGLMSGSALVYDSSAERFGLMIKDSVSSNATAAAPTDLIATVSQSTSSPISASLHQNPTFGVDAASRRGQFHIQTEDDDNGEDGDIWIYS